MSTPAERHAARQRRRYAEKLSAAVCVKDGCERKPAPGLSRCRKCLALHNAITKAAKAALRAARKAAGKCRECGVRPAAGYRCFRCRARKRNGGKV